MAETHNPFAPPSAPLAGSTGAGLWRDRNMVVVSRGGQFPARCVKCNLPASAPAKVRKAYWHHPAIYLLALLSPLIYIIVALIVRKQADVNPALCADHNKRRNLGITIGWIGSLLGLAMAVAGGATETCGLAVFGIFLMLGSMIAGLIMARIIYPDRIEKEWARFKGCGEPFLSTLPDVHGF